MPGSFVLDLSGLTDHFLGRDCCRLDEDGAGPALELAARWLLFHIGKMSLGWIILDNVGNVTTSPPVFSCQYTLAHCAVHQSPASSKGKLGLLGCIRLTSSRSFARSDDSIGFILSAPHFLFAEF